MSDKNYRKEIKMAALPLILSNAIFGIGVFEYPVGKQHRKFSIFYIIVILFIYGSAVYYSIPFLGEFGRRIEANQIITKAFVGSHIFLTVSSILLGMHRSEGLHLIIRQVLVADGTLQKLGIEPNYREVAKSQLLKTSIFVIAIFAVITLVNVTILYGGYITMTKVMFLIVLDFPILLMSMGDTNFINIIQYANSKLKMFNNMLKKRLTTTCDCPQHKNLLKYYLISVNDRRNIRNTRFSSEIIKDDFYMLSTARIAHLHYTQLCETVNQVFAFHILISMLVAIFTLTCALYHMYALLKSEKHRMRNHYVFEIAGTIVLYNSFRIFLFAKYCSDLADESVKTGDIIAEIYDENISEECKIEIFQFERQLIERPLKIQAMFQPVDYSFIQKAIAIVATYLIILTQCGDVSVEINDKS